MTAVASSSKSTPPLGKYLASSDKRTRDKAVKSLSTFLSSQNMIPEAEMDKLWKGIFYCFWMSDKPLVQQALATELAELMLAIPTASMSLSFLRGFWECTVREWSGIDRLRIDKYYMLVRRFVNASFRLLLREKWDSDTCGQYNEILTRQGGPLCPSDIRVPTSLAYHLSDIYMEELEKALAKEDQESKSPMPLSTIVSPFLRLLAQTPSGTTYKRIQTAFFEPLLSDLSPPLDEDEPPRAKRARLDDSAEDSAYPHVLKHCKDGPAALRKKLLRSLFEVASESDTKDSNRRKMYALWENAGDDADDA